jgi:multiple sugar transport system permease protein
MPAMKTKLDIPELEGLTEIVPKKVTAPLLTSNVLLAGLGAAFALPLLWLVLASLNSHASWSIAWPHFTLSNFAQSLDSGRGVSLAYSFELAFVATLVATATGTLAAYTFSRRHIPWKGPLLLIVLFLSGVPINVIIIPIYQAFSQLGWLSVLPAAIFLGVTALPFEIWIIKNFIDAVPPELEESARIEGVSTIRIITRIIVPLAAPGIAAAAIFGFVNAWGAFLIPLVLIENSAQQPGAVAMYGYITSAAVNYGGIAAFSIIYSVPVLLMYALMARFFRGGFVLSGAIKG